MIRVLCGLMLFGLATGLTYKWELPEVKAKYGDLWSCGVVPYTFQKNDFNDKQKEIIEEAMKTMSMKTKNGERSCIRFTKKEKIHPYSVKFEKYYGKRCWSKAVGRQEFGNIMYLGDDCFDKGIIIHELMHILGFLHEHVRPKLPKLGDLVVDLNHENCDAQPDRDNYVKIITKNILQDKTHYFEKMSSDIVTTQNLSYDYGSIMHFGTTTFGKQSRDTLKRLRNWKRGHKQKLSQTDVLRIQTLYSCLDDGSDDKNETQTDYEFHCDFEEALCEYDLFQSNCNDFNWTRRSGATPLEGTGPSRDHTLNGSGAYLYAEAQGHLGEVAKISTSIIEKGTYCLRFYFYSYGIDVGMLWLFIPANKYRHLLNKVPSANYWRLFELMVVAKESWSAQFISEVGDGPLGDVAIDDISITKGCLCS